MTAEAPISRLDLERFVLGRLDDAATAEIEGRSNADPELQARIDRLRSDITAAAEDLPVFQIPTSDAPALGVVSTPTPEPSATPSASPRRRSLPMPAIIGGAFAAAAGILLAVQPSSPSGEVFRGDFDLAVERVRAGSGTSVGLVVEARAGDKLQYTVTPDADGWWMVANIQDDGEVALWTPPRRATAGTPDQAAVQLDGYTGAERAYFILSDAPMELDVVREAYAQAYRKPLADLDTLPDLPARQRSILIVRSPAE